MDRFDLVALFGFLSFAGATVVVDLAPPVQAALLGGFVCSLAVWRVRDGRVWEALGLLSWLVAAVLVAIGLDGRPILLVGFFGSLAIGLLLLLGGRFEYLPRVWIREIDEPE